MRVTQDAVQGFSPVVDVPHAPKRSRGVSCIFGIGPGVGRDPAEGCSRVLEIVSNQCELIDGSVNDPSLPKTIIEVRPPADRQSQ